MSTPINIGIIGCGEVAQVVHIPTLTFLPELYRITYLCDISPSAVSHAASKIPSQQPVFTTQNAKELCSSPLVDAVLVLGSDEFHAEHVLLALKHDKHVFVEKPVTLTRKDALNIVECEKNSEGRVMVGYMRRYAAVVEDAIAEIGGREKIIYARVRDIIGPNSTFVGQSGTFPKKFSDFAPEDTSELVKRAKGMASEELMEHGVPATEQSIRMYRGLTGLGSHDLSLMREILGMPVRGNPTLGASLRMPVWNVLFNYGHFTVLYESGFHKIPIFDAHIEVYSENKSVLIQYDTPFVKGLPVTMTVRENMDGKFVERFVRNTYEDPYTLELKSFYRAIREGGKIKTDMSDALEDFELFGIIMKNWMG
ncbi:NAD(P)-binding protein [Choiromyces venosus 120613-1]|uniref:NAD(P)-binding protein n=1 Tax=Choiromyces venosus 120613-1 TaxID=1336337 RepID=A0A3N4K8B6_9PEZI|nr:NAD(P)-binding protein [Choiromyces venosus 120613-1]